MSPEVRQRWRLAIERPAGETQRDAESAWAEALAASGLPVASGPGGRAIPRLLFAAPLPVAVHGERELADLLLAERLRRIEVRTALERVAPPGHRLRDLYDVWPGDPGLPSLVTAADYQVRLGRGAPAADELALALRRLLDADRLERERGEGARARRQDLRPLIERAELLDAGSILLRLRHDPLLGSGRADEVVAILGELMGSELPVEAIVRERLFVRGEPG